MLTLLDAGAKGKSNEWLTETNLDDWEVDETLELLRAPPIGCMMEEFG